MKASWTRAKPKPFVAESYRRSQFCPSDPSFIWSCGRRDLSSLPLLTSGAGNCPLLWLAFQTEMEQNIWAQCSHFSSALLDHSSSNSTSPEKCPFPQKTVQPSLSLQPGLSKGTSAHEPGAVCIPIGSHHEATPSKSIKKTPPDAYTALCSCGWPEPTEHRVWVSPTQQWHSSSPTSPLQPVRMDSL